MGVELVGTGAAAQARQPIDLQFCNGSDAGTPTFQLDAGDHVVRSASGKQTGIEFDRLTLASDGNGAPMDLGPRGSVAAALSASSTATSASTPQVKVTSNGTTKMQLEVSGAKAGTPFWLVLGQSFNSGWKATVDGHDAGAPSLVDGYANGWLVTPQHSTFSVTLDWTPQTQVWIGFAISVATLLVCLFLAIRGVRSRRRRRAVAAAMMATSPADLDGEASLANPLVADGTRPSRALLIAGPIIAALVGAFVARWWVGAIAGVGVLLVLLRPRLRLLLTIGAPVALGVVMIYVAVHQYRNDFAADFNWPLHFDRVNDVAWLAVILLACDALVELLRTRPWQAHRRRSGIRKSSVTGS